MLDILLVQLKKEGINKILSGGEDVVGGERKMSMFKYTI